MLPLILNKRARHEFEVLETFLAGVVLTGGEVKTLRGKHGSLQGSFVKLINGEAWLINAQIPPYPYARNEEYDPKRLRKLLLKQSELITLQTASQEKGKTIIATKIGLLGRHIKVEIALARGKDERDRRQDIKKRDLERELRRDY
jgi:SsrA-binding protein